MIEKVFLPVLFTILSRTTVANNVYALAWFAHTKRIRSTKKKKRVQTTFMSLKQQSLFTAFRFIQSQIL